MEKSARFLAYGLILCLLVGKTEARAASYQPEQPQQAVETLSETWHDAARQRDVPIKVYIPKTGGPLPVIIFSHGLGGSRDGYEYLGRWWAGCGYAVVHLQHAGSDDEVWKKAAPAERRQALTRSVTDVSNAINRVKDVDFAIDELSKVNESATSPLKGRLDLQRIGMAGHSFGGWTTMAVAGQKLGPMGQSMAEARIKAAVEMSAPVLKSGPVAGNPYDAITIPTLHLTGTLDDSPLGETKAGERRQIFDGMTAAETGLVIFNGANHMTFAGPSLRLMANSGEPGKEAVFQKLICITTTAFWDAWLRDNAAAKDWLRGSGLKDELGTEASVEWKVR